MLSTSMPPLSYHPTLYFGVSSRFSSSDSQFHGIHIYSQPFPFYPYRSCFISPLRKFTYVFSHKSFFRTRKDVSNMFPNRFWDIANCQGRLNEFKSEPQDGTRKNDNTNFTTAVLDGNQSSTESPFQVSLFSVPQLLQTV